MPSNSKPELPQSPARRFKYYQQITESHCGPAVVQMLFDALHVDVSQEDITLAANAVSTIETAGTRIDQLAQATKKLQPQYELLYKTNSRLEDIHLLINQFEIPVAVEWQGIFDVPEEEDENEDYGHYSIISHIDMIHKRLIVVDPYKDFVDQDRILSFSQFLPRWWDTNEFTNSVNKKVTVIDRRLLFIIIPQDHPAHQKISLKPGIDIYHPF